MSQRGITPLAKQIDQTLQLPTDLNSYDLIIIDHYEATMEVFPLCQQIRKDFTQPLILFTYENDERFHLKAYEMGVEECVAKPIGIPLFLAKAFAWLHRAALQKAAGQELRVSNFRIDPERRLLTTPDGETLKLSNLENRLLYLLMANPGQVLTSEVLLDRIWPEYEDADSRLVKNLIYRLRRKIERDPQQPKFIKTVDSVGYAFRASE